MPIIREVSDLLKVEFHSAVARISINRAAKRNALSDDLVRALHIASRRCRKRSKPWSCLAKATISAPDSICPKCANGKPARPCTTRACGMPLRKNPVRPGAGDRRAARRGGRRRLAVGFLGAYSGGRRIGILCIAGRAARPVRRRRRLGQDFAPDRRFLHDRSDADRARFDCAGRASGWHFALSCRRRGGLAKGVGIGGAGGKKCADDQLWRVCTSCRALPTNRSRMAW